MTIDEKDALFESYTALNNSFNELLQKMEDLYLKKEQITEETFNALIAKGNEIQEKINQIGQEFIQQLTEGTNDINSTISNFEENTTQKTNEFNANASQKIKAVFDEGESAIQKINDYAGEKESVFDGKVEAIENTTRQGVKQIKDRTTQSIETIEQKAEQISQIFEKLMQDNLAAICAHLFSIEKVLMDKKIIKLTYKE